jgi:hypothetical protein
MMKINTMKVNTSFILVVLFVFLVVVKGTSPPYTHYAILTSDQVDTGSNSAAWGAAVLSYNANTGILVYTVVNNVSNTLYAHIHGNAFPGEDAAVLVTLSGFESGSNATVTGQASISSIAQSLNSGTTYINIHTTLYPNGEIRGQILTTGQQVTVLTPAQAGVTSSATGFALLTLSGTTLTTTVYHTAVNATYAHIHGPAPPGVSAGVLITLAGNATQAVSPIITTSTVTSDQITLLQSDLLYYNVHTEQNPNGEVRGQIAPIVNYLAQLDGQQDNVSSSSYGVGVAALYGSMLYTQVYHTISNPTLAHIHVGAPGVPGGVIFTYSPVTSPIIQNFTATTDQASTLASGGCYFNVHTAANPGGEIRGQILAFGAPLPSTTGGSSTTTGGSSTTTGGSSTTTRATTSTSTLAKVSIYTPLIIVSLALLATLLI